jgi:nitronate monooxygenase
MEKAGYDMQKLQNPGEVDYGNKLKPIADEAKAWKTVWSAGQGCAGIRDVIPAAALVQRISKEFHAALQEQAALLQKW